MSAVPEAAAAPLPPDASTATSAVAKPVAQAVTSTISGAAPAEDEEDSLLGRKTRHMDHCGSSFAIFSGNPFRTFWDTMMFILLLYTATWFLWELCFLHFHVMQPIEVHEHLGISKVAWDIWSGVYNWFFVLDVLFNFFFTFKDEEGHEIDCLKHIGCRYLQSYFVLDIMACIPDELTNEILKLFSSDADGGNLAKGAKLSRLNRISRLLRLLRLGRLAKMASLKKTRAWVWMQQLRGVRVINFFCMLFFSVHLLACGWYLVASLQEDRSETWLATRSDSSRGQTLLEVENPWIQWAHSMYFVLTVFTTVGFGDISASNVVEICAVIVIFMVGAVVHSILVGEVINVVTRVEDKDKFVAEQSELVQRFANHTEVGPTLTLSLLEWASLDAKNWMTHQYDVGAMKKLITGRYMHRTLMGQLPVKLFSGDLLRNQFTRCLTLFDDAGFLPPRLPLLMALSMYRSWFEDGEVAYQHQDHAYNLFLITSGTFSYIGQPRKKGGKDAPPRAFTTSDTKEEPLYPYMLFGKGSYLGDLEVLLNNPRPASCRCEVAGAALVLPRNELNVLIGEFPQYVPIWFSEGQRRERHRQRCLKRLRHKYKLQDFCAVAIQTQLRAWRSHGYKKRKTGVAGDGVHQTMDQANKLSLMTMLPHGNTEDLSTTQPAVNPDAKGSMESGEGDVAGSPPRWSPRAHQVSGRGPNSARATGAAADDRIDAILQSMGSMQASLGALAERVEKLYAKVEGIPGNQGNVVNVV